MLINSIYSWICLYAGFYFVTHGVYIVEMFKVISVRRSTFGQALLQQKYVTSIWFKLNLIQLNSVFVICIFFLLLFWILLQTKKSHWIQIWRYSSSIFEESHHWRWRWRERQVPTFSRRTLSRKNFLKNIVK